MRAARPERAAIFQQADFLSHIFLDVLPRAVEGLQLAAEQQVAAAELDRIDDHAAAVAERSKRDLGDPARQCVGKLEPGRPGRGKVANVGVISALAIANLIDRLGDQEIEVGPALAMTMGAHVDRHRIDEGREIGPVIKIESAQEILIGFAAARMLGRDQPRYEFEQITGAQHGASVNFLTANHPFRCRNRFANQVQAAAGDDDRLAAFGFRLFWQW